MEMVEFHVCYDGALGSEMDVRILTPSLIALNELLENSFRQINSDNESKLELRLSAANPGSVRVVLKLCFSTFGKILTVFTAKEENSLSRLLQVLGLKEGLKPGLLQLIPAAEGGKPQKDGRIILANGKVIEADSEVLGLYGNSQVRKNALDFVTPLQSEKISRIYCGESKDPFFEVVSDDFRHFSLPENDDQIKDYTSTFKAGIVSLSFKPEHKWKLECNENTYAGRITDGDFWDGVKKDIIRFGQNDVFMVTMKTVYSKCFGSTKLEHEFIRIHQVYPRENPVQDEIT